MFAELDKRAVISYTICQ